MLSDSAADVRYDLDHRIDALKQRLDSQVDALRGALDSLGDALAALRKQLEQLEEKITA